MSFFRLPRREPLPWANHNYTTPPGFKNALSSAFPNISFYWNMFFTVRRAGGMAVKGNYTAEEWVQSSYEIIRGMEKCGTIFTITGLDNFIGIEGPCVFIGNHMSTLETFALPCLIQPHKDVTYVVKESLLKYPFFGPVLASRKPIVVSRKDLRADLGAMLHGGAERLAQGRSIIVFPQSSRNVTLDPQHFNSIGVKMARKAGVPVVPVAIYTESWGTGRLVKDFGPIKPGLGAHFSFGSPINVTGNGKAEHAAVIEFIQSKLSELGLPVLKAARDDGENEGENNAQ